jgi:hypothetical protein
MLSYLVGSYHVNPILIRFAIHAPWSWIRWRTCPLDFAVRSPCINQHMAMLEPHGIDVFNSLYAERLNGAVPPAPSS